MDVEHRLEVGHRTGSGTRCKTRDSNGTLGVGYRWNAERKLQGDLDRTLDDGRL